MDDDLTLTPEPRGGLGGAPLPKSFAGGRYVVIERIGAGSFATVFHAFDERLDVPVAIKLLADQWSWDPETRSRFVNEARLLRALNSPAVVQIRDIAETPEGQPYLVMDYADRGTLATRLASAAHSGRRVSPADVLAVARGLREGLSVLHARRIAHRDIKPSNVLIAADDPRTGAVSMSEALLQNDERLMLGDLGLAKDLMLGSGLTAAAGTAGYMAPEQSQPSASIDTRADIFSASALLAEVASGQPPDPTRRYRDGQLAQGSPLPESLGAPLLSVLANGLDEDPAARHATIDEWYEAVQAALLPMMTQGLPQLVVPPLAPAPAHPSPPPARPRNHLVVGGAVAAAVLVALVALAVLLPGGGGGGGGVVAPTTAAAPAPTVAATTTVSPSTQAPSTSVPAATTTASTTTTAPATTEAAPPPAPTTTAAPIVTIATTTTTAPTTTAAPTTTRLQPAAQIVGPTSISRGVPAAWSVQHNAACVRGVWSLTGPVQPSNPNWNPGNGFQGTWNVQTVFTLSLTVFNEAGDSSVASITVTVV